MIAGALVRALRGMAHPRLLLLGVSLDVGLALVVAVPAGLLLSDAARHLPPEAAARLDPAWHEDFERSRGGALEGLADVAGLLAILHVAGMSVLAGGALGAFDRDREAAREWSGQAHGLREILEDCGRWALPMLRVTLAGVPAFLLLHAALGDWLEPSWSRWFLDVESEASAVLAEQARQAVLLAGVFLLATWLDLARAILVIERRRSALLALAAAGGRLLRHPVAPLGCCAVLLGAELVLMRAGSLAAEAAGAGSAWRLLAYVLVAQAVVALRVGLGLGRLAGLAFVVEEQRDRRSRPSPLE